MIAAHIPTRADLRSLHLTRRQYIALATPVALLATMIPAFQQLVILTGWPLGYFLGFVIYWVGWCMLLSTYLLGGVRPLLALFREGTPGRKTLPPKMHLALWWPIAFPLAFIFVPNLGKVSAPLLLGSLALGGAIGVTEEVLWRGVYMRLFPGNVWLNTIYPTAGFALWHLAPQLIRPNSLPGGIASFLAYTVALGLTYSYYARKSGSIRWCTVSHVVHDSVGLGARLYIP